MQKGHRCCTPPRRRNRVHFRIHGHCPFSDHRSRQTRRTRSAAEERIQRLPAEGPSATVRSAQFRHGYQARTARLLEHLYIRG
jgi:hypothetical protein